MRKTFCRSHTLACFAAAVAAIVAGTGLVFSIGQPAHASTVAPARVTCQLPVIGDPDEIDSSEIRSESGGVIGYWELTS